MSVTGLDNPYAPVEAVGPVRRPTSRAARVVLTGGLTAGAAALLGVTGAGIAAADTSSPTASAAVADRVDTAPDGIVTVTTASGDQRTIGLDGTVIEVRADGTRTVTAPDGRVLWVQGPGYLLTYDSDGTTVENDGITRTVRAADGTVLSQEYVGARYVPATPGDPLPAPLPELPAPSIDPAVLDASEALFLG